MVLVAVLVLVAVVIAIVNGVASANPGGVATTDPLVRTADATADGVRPARLVEWEALLLSGATSGRRGRERLGRRMRGPVGTLLADAHGLSLDDPRTIEVLGPEWSFLQGGPPPPGYDTDDASIARAVDLVLDRLGAPGDLEGR